jgi:hypothetical protein
MLTDRERHAAIPEHTSLRRSSSRKKGYIADILCEGFKRLHTMSSEWSWLAGQPRR